MDVSRYPNQVGKMRNPWGNVNSLKPWVFAISGFVPGGGRDACRSVSFHAHLVIIMDTQDYNGKFHAYKDYAVTCVANAQTRQQSAVGRRRLQMCFDVLNPDERILQKVPLPVESHLDHSFMTTLTRK